ncbi:hypothetical protein HanIR_Chr11g0558761 [Helianthus annuus]|nr:hypothetical protein HanIR_Chr11g0558761 [Helianthus annuus]
MYSMRTCSDPTHLNRTRLTCFLKAAHFDPLPNPDSHVCLDPLHNPTHMGTCILSHKHTFATFKSSSIVQKIIPAKINNKKQSHKQVLSNI